MLEHCAIPSLYCLAGNVISAAVGLVLVYINLQSEYELASLIRFEQFQKFGKNEVGALSSPATPKKNLHVLVHGYLCVRFYLPSSINPNSVPEPLLGVTLEGPQ